jgi:hypothetical protein
MNSVEYGVARKETRLRTVRCECVHPADPSRAEGKHHGAGVLVLVLWWRHLG